MVNIATRKKKEKNLEEIGFQIVDSTFIKFSYNKPTFTIRKNQYMYYKLDSEIEIDIINDILSVFIEGRFAYKSKNKFFDTFSFINKVDFEIKEINRFIGAQNQILFPTHFLITATSLAISLTRGAVNQLCKQLDRNGDYLFNIVNPKEIFRPEKVSICNTKKINY